MFMMLIPEVLLLLFGCLHGLLSPVMLMMLIPEVLLLQGTGVMPGLFLMVIVVLFTGAFMAFPVPMPVSMPLMVPVMLHITFITFHGYKEHVADRACPRPVICL
jgi:hypothetical protein